jgi:hypothetical protein
MPLRAMDFESIASANSAKRPIFDFAAGRAAVLSRAAQRLARSYRIPFRLARLRCAVLDCILAEGRWSRKSYQGLGGTWGIYIAFVAYECILRGELYYV